VISEQQIDGADVPLETASKVAIVLIWVEDPSSILHFIASKIDAHVDAAMDVRLI
jgi:hypothetical protein